MVTAVASDNPNESAFDRLERGIESSCDSGEMLTKWVSVMEIMDVDGDRGIWVSNNSDATMWDTLGLLQFAVKRLETHIEAMTHLAMEINSGDYDDDDE